MRINSFKELLHHTSLRARIWISIILVAVPAIWITGLSTQYMASKHMQRKTAELSQTMIDKAAQAMEEKLRKVRLAVNTFMMSPSFEELLQSAPNEEQNYYQYFVMNKALQVPLNQMLMVEPAIESVLIVTPGGEYFTDRNARLKDIPFEDTMLARSINTSPSLPVWLPAHADPLFAGGVRVLSLIFEPITGLSDHEIRVVVNVKESTIKDYVEKDAAGEAGSIVVLNTSGVPMMYAEEPFYSLASDPLTGNEVSKENTHFRLEYGKKNYLVNWARVTFPDNWILLYFQREDFVLREVRNIRWTTFGLMLALVPLAFLLSKWITDNLIKPLHRLQHLMNLAGDSNLSVRFHSEYQDEVTHVGERFNIMLEKIGLLIEEVSEAERQKRKSEIKALQSQIDPHFLYNTLNTILWKSQSGMQKDVNEMIVSLSRLFRLGLNNGMDLTSVAKELEHVGQYLRLQQQCYEELFEFRIEAEEGVEGLSSLKVLLQPLVENSILHGFRNEDFKGLIVIRVFTQAGFLVYCVEDNGKGFDVAKIRRRLEGGNGQADIYAMHNIYGRLKLQYGEAAAMELESEPYVKTTVTIRFPLL